MVIKLIEQTQKGGLMKSQVYDYSKLRGRIIEKYGTLKAFADAMGIDVSTLSKRLRNLMYWPQPDIEKACGLLDIADPMEYFFARTPQFN